MRRIVIATGNAHKFRELRAMLRVPGVAWSSLAAHPDAPTVVENGRTFRANAVKKARAVARATRQWALADDSGLEVDALGGAPGVRSARYAGRHGDDARNNAKLLRLLRRVPEAKRTARFRCALALASPTRLLATTEGTIDGRIGYAARGRHGFGYDPLFVVPRLQRTTAQLSPAEKNRLSHRGRAARLLRARLQQLLKARREDVV